jgi:hypothetical protein
MGIRGGSSFWQIFARKGASFQVPKLAKRAKQKSWQPRLFKRNSIAADFEILKRRLELEGLGDSSPTKLMTRIEHFTINKRRR